MDELALAPNMAAFEITVVKNVSAHSAGSGREASLRRTAEGGCLYTRFIAFANLSTGSVLSTSSLVSQARRACRIP